jgi:Cu2+-exporting ATPase
MADHEHDHGVDVDHGDEHAEHGGGHGHHGHDHGDHIAQFRERFWWNLLLAIPVVVFSEMFADLLGYDLPPGTAWVSPVLGTVIFFYGGWPFLSGGLAELRARQPGMMLLIAFAITVAFIASAATSLGVFGDDAGHDTQPAPQEQVQPMPEGHDPGTHPDTGGDSGDAGTGTELAADDGGDDLDLDFWWELALLIVIMLLGHWLEMKAVGQAQNALAALAALLPDEADRIADDGGIERVPSSELGVGDLVLVRPGGRVPADGVIVEGETEVDESMITGESRPVPKQAGDRVVAGTIATDSSIRVRVDAVGDDTALAGIQRLVSEAQASKSRAQALADRAAALLFYVATASGIVTFVVWMLLGDTTAAVEHTVTVLIIACPHALGLAIPLVIVLSTAIAARAGILVKDRLALERMREIDTVLFDKTGTLTKGEHVVAAIAVTADAGLSDDALLAVAGAVESDSEHPLARAVVRAARDRGALASATDFRSITGRGVEATVEGARVAVGGPAMLRERELEEPASLRGAIDAWKQRGAAVLYVVRDSSIVGALALEDEIRPESRVAIEQLHARGIKVVMITGDARQVADAVGEELGIDEVFAEVLPEDKDKAVAELQGRGLRVAMVGDGVNDAPALARADVGIAIGAGTDVAIESAGVVLASSDPRAVVSVIRLSGATYRKMLENLAWGAGYNLVAIPLAAGALAWAGITLAPAVGAILMSASTVVVALNAQLLRRLDLTAPPIPEPDRPVTRTPVPV